MRNGPTGGDAGDVEPGQAVIASTDPVAVDAYAGKGLVGPRRAAAALPAPRRGAGPGRAAFESLRTAVSAV